ncbi:hypothetical protein [Anaerovorax sp. IOR16]|uniref:hypothetical protein n=1 Tax=Anaerovorax sp. IOR16 TaxID=2773458 RepID=UPI0019CFEC22|nr:hypothetical protein [Anaerovorax sp. IOR16]
MKRKIYGYIAGMAAFLFFCFAEEKPLYSLGAGIVMITFTYLGGYFEFQQKEDK